MLLTEKEHAIASKIIIEKCGEDCLLCKTGKLAVGPISFEFQQEMSKLVQQVMIVSLLLVQCDNCKNITFFNRSIITDHEKKAINNPIVN